MQPKDEAELANMIFTAIRIGKPMAIRYPRGCGPGVPIPSEFQEIPVGKAEAIRSGAEIQIWALGDMIPLAQEAADLLAKEQRKSVGVVNARFVRPLDEALLLKQAADTKVFVTLENGLVTGGFGVGMEEFLRGKGFNGRVLKVGWPDEFIPHGAQEILMTRFGLTARSILSTVMRLGI
jgi:1-deoxy-D-xylulose-5-phosphate synthase